MREQKSCQHRRLCISGFWDVWMSSCPNVELLKVVVVVIVAFSGFEFVTDLTCGLF